MQALCRLGRPCHVSAAFNSLFEMPRYTPALLSLTFSPALSILYLRCVKADHLYAAARPASAFNSLFEMLLNALPLNALPRSHILSILYLRCMFVTTQRSSSFSSVILSILYLRCAVLIQYSVLKHGDSFNSLFEMRNSLKRGASRRDRPFNSLFEMLGIMPRNC